MTNSYGLGHDKWLPPDQAAADEYFAYIKEFDQSLCLSQVDRTVASCGKVCVGPSAGETLAADLSALIAQRKPASYIRLGDADGNVLFSGLEIFPALTHHCLDKISRIYFGDETVMVRHRDFFLETVTDAIAKADVIGGPLREVVKNGFSTSIPEFDVRGQCGLRGVYNYLASAYDLTRLADKTWAGTFFSRDLLPHYFSILHRQPYLGFITCYPELEGIFRERAEIAETETIPVPMQASIARSRKDIRHYPDAYPGILERIRPPFEGAVYIVAAGILSKPYCTTIKERGGIAIDVGSVADVWMGKRSRPNIRQSMLDKWSLSAGDNPAPEPKVSTEGQGQH